MFYSLQYTWIATRGFRFRPWQSPYLRWRIETFSGTPADSIDFKTFWSFFWTHRKELVTFMRWCAQMKKIHGMK